MTRSARYNLLIVILALILALLLGACAWLWLTQPDRQSSDTPDPLSPQSGLSPSAQTADEQPSSEPKITALATVLATQAQPEVSKPVTPVDSNADTPAAWPEIQVNDGRTSAAVPYTVDGIVLVNRKHLVNWDYVPPLETREGVTMQPEALEALLQMREAALAEGLTFYVRSAYRSFGYQVQLRQQYLRTDPGGEASVDRYSAPPGASEHQTGLACDLDEGNGLSDQFDQTPVGQWIHAHAHEYGFILRFPDGKEYTTGYEYEPWHFRYVGREVAAAFAGHPNLTLEEYLQAEDAPAPHRAR